MISNDEAREIASHWHSPSPHSDQITRVSHELPVTDWPRLHAQIEYEMGKEITTDDWWELRSLLEWVEASAPSPRVPVTLTCAHNDGAMITIPGVTTKADARVLASDEGWVAVLDETNLSVADLCPAHNPHPPAGSMEASRRDFWDNQFGGLELPPES